MSPNTEPNRSETKDDVINSANIAAAEAAQAAHPSPTPEPQPVSQPTPQTTPQPVSQPTISQPVARPAQPAFQPIPQPAPQPPKKKPVALIVTLSIVGALVLALGATAVWFFGFYNQPERMALDAVSQLITADHVTVSGEASFTQFGSLDDEEDQSDAQTTKITTDLQYNKGLPQSFRLEVSGAYLEQAGLDKLSLAEQFTKDGQLFLQTEGVDDILGRLSPYSSSSVNTLDFNSIDGDFTVNCDVETDTGVATNCVTVKDEEDDEEDFELPSIDNTWWMIDVQEVAEYLDWDDELTENVSCLVNAASSTDYLQPLAQAYAKNPFLKIERYAGTEFSNNGDQLFTIGFDADLLASFLVEATNDVTYPKLNSCNANLPEYTAEQAQSLAEAIAGTELPEIVLAIDTFTHHLNALYIATSEQSDDDVVTSMSSLTLNFTYPAELEISTPTEYTSLTDLLDDLGLGGSYVNTFSETYLSELAV